MEPILNNIADEHLLDTQRAFDQVAEEYDGSLGNNLLIQGLRRHFLSVVKQTFTAGNHLLDIGCGTGIDAVTLAREGYWITAIDWSEAMVERTRLRARKEGVSERIFCHHMGAHELVKLPTAHLDGIYSDLGAVNCIMNLSQFAQQCERILKREGRLIASVINRFCPWEIGYYLLRGRWKRALIRFKRGPVAVNLEGEKVWSRYFSPRELYRYFKGGFQIDQIRSMNLFAPPPYLLEWAMTHPVWFKRLQSIDHHVDSWPLFRSMGDHFMIKMQKRE